MNDFAPAPGYALLHVLHPMVSGGASRCGGLSVVFRDSVAVRHHPLPDKFFASTFELQLVRVGLPPSTIHAIFNICQPQRIPQWPTSVTAVVDELGDDVDPISFESALHNPFCSAALRQASKASWNSCNVSSSWPSTSLRQLDVVCCVHPTSKWLSTEAVAAKSERRRLERG